MEMKQKNYLVLFAHGSRDPDWQAPFIALRDSLHPLPVGLAFMEMAEPTLEMVVTQALVEHSDLTQMTILPLFMAQGGHLRHDVPNQVAAMQARYPNCTFTVLPPVGQHPKVVAAMQDLCRDAFKP
jgi:sirohydrochlorin cobaltochelatase